MCMCMCVAVDRLGIYLRAWVGGWVEVDVHGTRRRRRRRRPGHSSLPTCRAPSVPCHAAQSLGAESLDLRSRGQRQSFPGAAALRTVHLGIALRTRVLHRPPEPLLLLHTPPRHDTQAERKGTHALHALLHPARPSLMHCLQGEWIPSDGQWPVGPQEDVAMDHGRIWVDGCFDFSHHGTHAPSALQPSNL